MDQGPESATRPHCPCPDSFGPLPLSTGPKAVKAQSWTVSPCLSRVAGVVVSSPVYNPASLKDLGSTLQVAYLLDGPSDRHLLLSQARVQGCLKP